MKTFLVFACIIASFSWLAISCKKDDKCTAGTGGQVELVLFPQHHSRSIFSQPNYVDSAFIKFNTQEFPGENPSLYDLVVAGEVGEEHVHVPNLKCGDYFVFMTGFDTLINQRVKGGVPISFSATTGEVDENIPVTEGD